MTDDIAENIACEYRVSDGWIKANMSMPLGCQIAEEYTPPDGYALLVGQHAPDVNGYKVVNGEFVAIGA